MKSRIVSKKILSMGTALLLTVCLAPALVLGQNNDDEKNKEREREKAKHQAAPKKPAPQPERTSPPPVQQSRPAQPKTEDSRGRSADSGKPDQPILRNRNNPGGQPNQPASVRDQSNRTNQPNASVGAQNNQARTAFRPPPNASTTARADGGAFHRTPDGKQWETNRSGQVTHFSNATTDVRLRDNGRIDTVRVTRPDRSQMVVNRSLNGTRTVEVVREDRTRIVTYGPRVGFVERPVRAGFVSRTYVVSGRPVAYVYQTRVYGGVTFYHYVPPVYYAPVFYGWAWNPWARPVVYSWGWGADPWYGYYGGYYTPAPVYPSAALWLTDFLLAADLQIAYEQRQAAPPADVYDPGPSPVTQSSEVTLSPEVKQAIAEEVRMQLAEMQNSSGQPAALSDAAAPPEALDPNQRIFVVSMNLDVTSGNRPCVLTPGDIILRSGDTLNGTKVGVTVLNSKAGDCAVNSGADIEAADLQEMHNQFREQIDSGMAKLANNQGQDGIPSGPAPAPRPVAAGTAEADANAAQILRQQQQDGAAIEDQARQNALNGN